MSDAPKLAVMIPVRNEAENIVRCLRGLLNQTLKPVQVVICDQGSTDMTPERASRVLGMGNIPFAVVSQPRLPLLGKWNISRAYWAAS